MVRGRQSYWARRPDFWVALAAVATVVGCVGAAADHETLGDRAYADRLYSDALVEYRLALVGRAPDAALRAKAGGSALGAGDLTVAAEEYVALAQEGGDTTEAADGLVRVAHAAIDASNQEALTRALVGLQEVAPGRALGAFAQQLSGAIGPMPRSRDALSVLVFAAAAAPDAGTQDSLLYVYAVGLKRLALCKEAIPVFESLLRRQRVSSVVAGTREQLALCALTLGRIALDQGQPTVAETWFEVAAAGGGTSRGARAAYIGLGDVRLAQGDFFGAAVAYERARDGASPADSIYRIASERLNRMGRIIP